MATPTTDTPMADVVPEVGDVHGMTDMSEMTIVPVEADMHTPDPGNELVSVDADMHAPVQNDMHTPVAGHEMVPVEADMHTPVGSHEMGTTQPNKRKMLRSLLSKGVHAKNGFNFVQFNPQRMMHTRNKKAAEFIAKGWNALREVDRVIDYCEREDKRLIPMLKTAKENFELALEVDNLNSHARYWLSKLHLKYHVPGACKAIGAALLVEAAEMGNKDALYELGCKLRVDMHPGALYLLGAVYLTGDCVKKDLASALWCFHRASERGHAGAAIAYGSLLLRGVEAPESLTRLEMKKRSLIRHRNKKEELLELNPIEMARKQFEIAAKAGCDLGFRWLKRLEEEEKRLMPS
ncbi:OLC1v1038031C1 [Oldenlandia corymbosa var. corymbosa]|uniref:OLC1v1038031C1 n=1 Tax=Oldenlandia corymbosa var. corymbosa TaxID=529605 RepID=A0AAV1CZS6_OLDCO|nr:OLC1v1038031C1 [Oldenlandia corymbosa var. corymbosa]